MTDATQQAPEFENPYEFFSHTDLPAVTLERVIASLNEDDFGAVAHPETPNMAVAQRNDLDWVFSITDELVRVECVLPTELDFAEIAPVFHVITNELNAAAFDGRALVGDVDGHAELRGDATFTAGPGMNDDQLFHALNYAVVAAQEALLGTLDNFNEFARTVQERDAE